MHSLNHFLISAQPDDTIASVQDGQFGTYVNDKFDDNNWYTPLALTIKGGKTEISDDDYRGGFDAWIEDRDGWNFDAAIEAAYKSLYVSSSFRRRSISSAAFFMSSISSGNNSDVTSEAL